MQGYKVLFHVYMYFIICSTVLVSWYILKFCFFVYKEKCAPEDRKQQNMSEEPHLTENRVENNKEAATAAIANEESVPTPEDMGANQNAEVSLPSTNMATNRSENTAHAPYDTHVKGSGDVTQATYNNEELHSTHKISGKDLLTTAECPPDALIITKF